MPEVLRVRGYRFFFFSREAPHMHVEQAERYAKFWLNPVSLARNRGFRSHELTELLATIEANRALLLEKWHEHFGRQN